MVDRNKVETVLRTYAEAWMEQDPEKILTIFTSDATYHERVLKEPFRGHAEIKQYWQSKVVEEQKDIKFKLLNTYIDGDTVIAEWDAVFFNNAEQQTIHLREVAILEFQGDKISSLREYWHSERL
jgi:uncharacterized protein (TIGR02246 family)